jgi:hypothetical protein
VCAGVIGDGVFLGKVIASNKLASAGHYGEELVYMGRVVVIPFLYILRFSKFDIVMKTLFSFSSLHLFVSIIISANVFAEAPPSEWIRCQEDNRCISVPADKCGCGGGGKATAINKEFEKKWLKKIKFQEMSCVAEVSSDPSCTSQPICRKKECRLQ